MMAGKDTKFTVLHVMENIPNYAMMQIPAQYLDDTREMIEGALKGEAAKLEGSTPVLISGTAGRAIVNYAKEHGADCIVVASHQLGLSDIFLGSTAAKVVRHANCSVHVIR
jgi:nucleotide-binding universal stress UspA family protein